MDDRDGAYRSRGQSPRRRPNEYELDARDMSGPRSRPPRRDYDDETYARASRDPRYAARGGPSNRNDRDDRNDYDRRSSGGSSSSSGRRRNEGGEYPNRPSRADGYDRSGRSSRSDPGSSYPRGERPVRDGRPPMRDDGLDDPRGGRSGGRGGYAGDSNARMRRPAPQGRGGLWDDQPSIAMAARARYVQNQQADDEEEEGSAAVGFIKALGAIVLALILGVGAAYGYSLVSAPHLNVPADQQVTPTAPASTPSTTPSTTPAPSATKSAALQPASGAPYTFIF